VFAEDGKSAVEKASTEKPDLVFIDGLMPKMHGFLACKAIKELDAPPKVILLTGIYTKPAYKWEAKGTFGADDLLKKPSSPEELLACIEKHLPSETNYLDASENQTEQRDRPIEASCDSVAAAAMTE
jgi:DNA-binding response OmpR family regulator